MNFDINSLQKIADTALTHLTEVGLTVVGAIVLFIVGRWLIRIANRMLQAAFLRQRLDHTLVSYIGSSVNVLLNIVLIIAILSYFGVETTSFAALIAAMGIAIGAAWAGLLSTTRRASFSSCCVRSRSATS